MLFQSLTQDNLVHRFFHTKKLCAPCNFSVMMTKHVEPVIVSVKATTYDYLICVLSHYFFFFVTGKSATGFFFFFALLIQFKRSQVLLRNYQSNSILNTHMHTLTVIQTHAHAAVFAAICRRGSEMHCDLIMCNEHSVSVGLSGNAQLCNSDTTI